MKVVFESEYVGWSESATRVVVAELSENEYDDVSELSHEEKCELFGVFDESGYEVMPGASYHTYSFEVTTEFIIMYDTLALNV